MLGSESDDGVTVVLDVLRTTVRSGRNMFASTTATAHKVGTFHILTAPVPYVRKGRYLR